MRAWAFFLGGLLVWAAQFFLLYGIASIWLTSLTARLLAIAVTIAAIVVDVWLIMAARNRIQRSHDHLQRWLAGVALVMAALSLLAVTWQGIPALLA